MRDDERRGRGGEGADDGEDDFDLPPDVPHDTDGAGDEYIGDDGPAPMDPDAPEVDEDDPYAALHAMRERERPKLRGPLNRNPDDPPDGAGYWDDVQEGGDKAAPRRAGAIPRPTGRRPGGRGGGRDTGRGGKGGLRRTRRPQFRAGEAISKTLSAWSSNLIPFTILSAVVLSPAIVINILVAAFPPEEGDVMMAAAFGGGSTLLTLLLQQLAIAALVFGVFQHLRGQSAAVGDCLHRGLTKILPVIGVGFVTFLLMMLPIMPVMVVGVIAAVTKSEPLIIVAVLLGIVGLVFLVALVLGLQVAVPAAVVGGLGPFEAVKRSWELTKGHRGAIWGALFVIGFINALIGGAVGGAMATAGPIGIAIAEQVASVFAVSLSATLAAVIYHDLRVSKEGIETSELASVFD